ncbi:hydrogenase formation protein HypD [Pseudomaricurvus alkylphenolicus]|nr:hydrogenase formation protein HypD [Pseudomaricurvus alkylphenolicus]
MKYQSEFRQPEAIRKVLGRIHERCSRPWTIMEVCGGQTHTIARYAIETLLPDAITLIHGPGCPVCVTPLAMIERARILALEPGVILCTFGDMMRVPGQGGDLFEARARGADVRIVTSSLDAVAIARQNPQCDVVLFAVGFETTAPTTAMAVKQAAALSLSNFSLLAAHVRVPPAMSLILSSPENRVDAFLAAGHVCTVAGVEEYPDIAERFSVPVIITGFEPLDILLGIEGAVRQLESGVANVENRYARSVFADGNPLARAAVSEVFEVVDQHWRGIGIVPAGGLKIREAFGTFDAQQRYDCDPGDVSEPRACMAAKVLQGLVKPAQCPEFGRGCTPEHPLGAPMVSTEGACAAYYRYRSTEIVRLAHD